LRSLGQDQGQDRLPFSLNGHEVSLPTWTAAQAEDWPGRWAMNLILINVSTRKLRRPVQLPNGDAFL
jgi:putative transposase